MPYQTWGSTFTNTGSVKRLSGQTDKFVFLPEFIWTKKLLGVTNFFEVVTPAGSASQNVPNTSAPNSSGGLGDVSAALPQTGRVMVKDEDLCVHCGLCAERCPTAAWDMQKSRVHWPHAADEAAALDARKPKIA